MTDTAIRNVKSGEKACKLFDASGLYLLVKPSGVRLWRMNYRVDGREKLISLGQYPDVPFKSARERRDEARRLIAGMSIRAQSEERSKPRALMPSRQSLANTWAWQRCGGSRNAGKHETAHRVRASAARYAEWQESDLAMVSDGFRPIA